MPTDEQQKVADDIAQQIRARGVAGDMKKSYSSMSALDLAGTALTNIPASASKFVENTVQPFIHPIETVQKHRQHRQGRAAKTGLLSGDDAKKYADAVGGCLVARYGSKQAIPKHSPMTR